MRAVAVERADVAPASPVYQITVLAVVPAVTLVAVSKGGPATRCGGLLKSAPKKSFEAVTAEAALSELAARPQMVLVSSAVASWRRLRSAWLPMANWLVPGGVLVVAVSVRFWLVPSGRVRLRLSVSPSLGWPVKSTDRLGGEPLGPLTVALLKVEVTEPSLKPKGETASSATATEVAVGGPMTRRPRPSGAVVGLVRSSMSWLRPARAPSPLMM